MSQTPTEMTTNYSILTLIILSLKVLIVKVA